MNFNDLFEDFSRILQEYSKHSPRVVTKAIKKQVGVAHVIPFASNDTNF
jgi:hypothetical protein